MDKHVTGIGKKTGFFRYKQLGGTFLLTNDVGDYCHLDLITFDNFIVGKLGAIKQETRDELIAKHFIVDPSSPPQELVAKYAIKERWLGKGTALHIIVVTLRCDHKCLYCQSNAQSMTAHGFDMDESTAKRVVDRIFESPNPDITIEFQGGEPLANFKVIQYIIEYAKKKKKTIKKKIFFALVSNMSLMDNKKLAYLMKHKVSLCTSLDGPAHIHNKNRIYLTGKKDSHKMATVWLKRLQKEYKKGNLIYKPNALLTVTRFSLPYPKQIVNEYVRLGLEAMSIRPISPFGMASKLQRRLGYSAEEFIKFYTTALDHIIAINQKGKYLFEKTAQIILTKILTGNTPLYFDLMSPCGAGIGQLAYNYNGDVYTCDEGRMMSMMGDYSFQIGNVHKNAYTDMVHSETVKTMCVASCLDNLPGCCSCVYKPYCGVCPIYNYATNGTIFTQANNNDRCKIYMKIMDYLFSKLKEASRAKKGVLQSWVKK